MTAIWVAWPSWPDFAYRWGQQEAGGTAFGFALSFAAAGEPTSQRFSVGSACCLSVVSTVCLSCPVSAWHPGGQSWRTKKEVILLQSNLYHYSKLIIAWSHFTLPQLIVLLVILNKSSFPTLSKPIIVLKNTMEICLQHHLHWSAFRHHERVWKSR